MDRLSTPTSRSTAAAPHLPLVLTCCRRYLGEQPGNSRSATGFNLFAKPLPPWASTQTTPSTLWPLSRGELGGTIPVVAGSPDTSTTKIGNFDDNLFGNFKGVDSFNGGGSDYDLFSLAPGSPDLNIFDPVIGRDLSAADIFVSDFDGSFALYATAESLGLNAADNITGFKPLPLADVPEPTTLGLLSLALIAAPRRQSAGDDGQRNGDDYKLIKNAFNTQSLVSYRPVSAGRP